jgi:nitroreductase
MKYSTILIITFLTGALEMNDVINAIKSRRSVRSFKSGAISKETLQAIVEAGCYAPTGHNGQPWHFSVVQDRALLEEVNAKAKQVMSGAPVDWIQNLGRNPLVDITHKAPALILVSCKEGAITGPTDCTAAMENMMIAAESLGVGSCWMGFVNFIFKDADMMKKLGVPEGYEPQQAAVFGYPNEKKQAPERNPDVVTYIGEF